MSALLSRVLAWGAAIVGVGRVEALEAEVAYLRKDRDALIAETFATDVVREAAEDLLRALDAGDPIEGAIRDLRRAVANARETP